MQFKVYSKDETSNFDVDFASDDNFKIFKCKTKSVGSTVADGNNGMLRKAIAVSLKHLNNFWRSLKIPLINCKVELKLKWAKYCVLVTASVDNIDANRNNIIFTIKDTNLYAPVVTISGKDNEKLSKHLNKSFESQFIGMNITQKVGMK